MSKLTKHGGPAADYWDQLYMVSIRAKSSGTFKSVEQLAAAFCLTIWTPHMIATWQQASGFFTKAKYQKKIDGLNALFQQKDANGNRIFDTPTVMNYLATESEAKDFWKAFAVIDHQFS